MATRAGLIVALRSGSGDQRLVTESPAFQLTRKRRASPVHDEAPRETVGIRRRPRVGRGWWCMPSRNRWRAPRPPSRRRNCRGLRRDRRSARPLGRISRSRSSFEVSMVSFCTWAGSPRRRTWSIVWAPIVTTVGAGQLRQFGWRQRSGRRGVTSRGRPTAPTRRRGHGGSRPREGAAAGAVPLEVRLELGAPSPIRTVPSGVGRADLVGPPAGGSAAACPGDPTRTPVGSPSTPLVTKTVIGTPLASAIGRALMRLSA